MIAPVRLMLPLSCAAIGLIAESVLAQEKTEQYVTKAERNVLFEKPLPGVDGKIISINHFKMPTDYVGGKHYHSGPTYVYVLKGTLTVDEEGKPTQTFEAGQLYVEPIGSPMPRRATSSTSSLRSMWPASGPRGWATTLPRSLMEK